MSPCLPILFIKSLRRKKRRKRVCLDAEEFQREHERLLTVLRSPGHADDLAEAKAQAREVSALRKARILFSRVARSL